MTTENVTVADIMVPMSSFPCLKESSTVQEAIQQLRSFCPVGSASPCGFSELMVVDDNGGLIGRVTQQGILRILFSSLLDTVDIQHFEGRTPQHSDLSTLLNGVLIREGVNHLNASLTRVTEKCLRVLTTETELIHAMSIMVITKEAVLPVVKNGKLTGVVNLSEVFGALGDNLIRMNS